MAQNKKKINLNLSGQITIVLVLYKSDDVILKCLNKIKNFKKIIVDNSNNPILKRKIIKSNTKIEKYILTKNIGYSRAANLGFSFVKTKFCLILSPDVLINKKNIISLKKIFSKYSNVGIVSPCFFLKGTSQVNYSSFPIKKEINRSSEEKKILNILKKKNNIDGDLCTNWVWGACILIRTNILKKIKLYNPKLWIYWSDVDLCFKIKKIGLSVIQTTSAKATHYIGKSSNYSYMDKILSTIDHKKSEFIFYKINKYKYKKKLLLQILDFSQRIIVNAFKFNLKKSFKNILRIFALFIFIIKD